MVCSDGDRAAAKREARGAEQSSRHRPFGNSSAFMGFTASLHPHIGKIPHPFTKKEKHIYIYKIHILNIYIYIYTPLYGEGERSRTKRRKTTSQDPAQ